MRTIGREAKKSVPDNVEELKKEIKSLKSENTKLSKRIEELKSENKEQPTKAD